MKDFCQTFLPTNSLDAQFQTGVDVMIRRRHPNNEKVIQIVVPTILRPESSELSTTYVCTETPGNPECSTVYMNSPTGPRLTRKSKLQYETTNNIVRNRVPVKRKNNPMKQFSASQRL